MSQYERTSPRKRLAATPVMVAGLLGLAVVAAVGPAGAALYTVGPASDPDCTHTSLEDAVDAADASNNHDEIRLTSNVELSAPLSIQTSMTIIGGYESCAGTRPPESFRMIRNPAGRVFEIHGSLFWSPVVSLENLYVTGDLYWSDGSPPGRTAGGIAVEGNANVVLHDVAISRSHAVDGGGGLVMSDWLGLRPTVLIERDEWDGALFYETSSQANGGAIDCRDGSLTLVGADVGFGRAADRGGAIGLGMPGDATHSCSLELERVSIVRSRAYRGGAISATESQISGFDVSIANNEADRDGGGVYLIGNSSALLSNTAIFSNTAAHGGGAAVFASELELFGEGCLVGQVEGCSGLIGNRAGAGSAVRGFDAYLRLAGTTVRQNGELGAGSVIELSESQNRLFETESSWFVGNYGHHLVRVEGKYQTFISVRHATVLNNTLEGSAFVYESVDGGDAAFDILSSLYFTVDGTPLVSSSGATLPEVRCLVTNATGVAATNVRQVGRNQVLAADGIHLVESSPAIDLCSGPGGSDIFGAGRPVDIPGVGELGMAFDAGAVELGGFVPSIFADGFESGDLSAW